MGAGSGAKYRGGEFAKASEGVLTDLSKQEGNVILFIDELHHHGWRWYDTTARWIWVTYEAGAGAW